MCCFGCTLESSKGALNLTSVAQEMNNQMSPLKLTDYRYRFRGEFLLSNEGRRDVYF